MRAVSWANAGQPVGILGDLPASVADGLLTVRAEWQAIEAEHMAESRRKAAAHGNR